MTKSVIATLHTAVPCGVYKSARDAICGKPATVIILDQLPGAVPLIGRWAGLPICRECAAETLAVYQDDAAVAVNWLTLADAAAMAHERQPEKYSNDTNQEVVRLRRLLTRNDWEGQGMARKTAGGHWQVHGAAFEAYLKENKGRYVARSDSTKDPMRKLVAELVSQPSAMLAYDEEGGVSGVRFLDDGSFVPWDDLGYNSTFGLFDARLFPNQPSVIGDDDESDA